jgi:hypothetical protein
MKSRAKAQVILPIGKGKNDKEFEVYGATKCRRIIIRSSPK